MRDKLYAVSYTEKISAGQGFFIKKEVKYFSNLKERHEFIRELKKNGSYKNITTATYTKQGEK